jgi:hypoxanthine phosphoribosyltransferase
MKEGRKMIDLEEVKQAMVEADCLATPQQVDEAMARMAAAISAQLRDRNPLIYCVMNGGLVLAGRLLCLLDFPLQQSYIHATRYGNSLCGDQLDWRVRPTQDLRGKTVLVLDDILDEGHTLKAILNHFKEEGAAAVYSAVLVHKVHERKAIPDMRADFSGLDIEDRYLFGCGMDYKGYWRNAPGIYALKGH